MSTEQRMEVPGPAGLDEEVIWCPDLPVVPPQGALVVTAAACHASAVPQLSPGSCGCV